MKWLLLSFLLFQDGEKLIQDAYQDSISLIEKGEYRQAEKAFEELLKDSPDHPSLLLGRGRVRLETGRYKEAIEDFEKASQKDEKNSEINFWYGEVLSIRGEYVKAQEQYEKVSSGPYALSALEGKAEALWDSGKREESKKTWKEITTIASKRYVELPRELISLGKSYEFFKKYEPASEVYQEALQKDPNNPQASQALGDLYFKVYADTAGTGHKPEPVYRNALKKNPRSVGVLLSLFQLFQSNFAKSQDETEEFFKKALATNPNSVRGLLMQADGFLRNRRFNDATVPVQRALEINPNHLSARAYQATIFFLKNETEKFHQAEQEILKIDPQFGELYATLGGLVSDLYRFADAVPWLRKALELDPDLNGARTDLGQALANSGAEIEAKAVLEAAEKAEPGFVHPWRHNMLIVLGELHNKYLQTKAPPFHYFFHPDEAEVLKVYLMPLYEEVWKELSTKYSYTPQSPVYVETFHEAGDFSTRTIGFTGFGALGACFGNTVTAVSPAAVEFRHHFNYLETAWHEFAHVITLGLSKARIPRWLTEGLSTYEEKQRNGSYDRGMEIDLLDAYANDEIYPLIELNSAFRGPRIIFGYYQGGLICEFLSQQYSFSKIVQMVKLYGEDKAEEEIFKQCFGISTKEFDKQFLEYVKTKLQQVRVEPRYNEKMLSQFRDRVRKDPKDLFALRRLAWSSLRRNNVVDAELRLKKLLEFAPKDPEGLLIAGEVALLRGRKDVALKNYEEGFKLGAEEFFARLHYANLLEEAKEYQSAFTQYQLAKKAFPRFRDRKSSPYVALRRMLSGEGKLEESMKELEDLVALDSSLYDERLELAAWYVEKKDFDNANRYFVEANGVDPFSRELHIKWAEALREAKRYDESVREWKVARMVKLELEANPPRESDPRADQEAQSEILFEEATTQELAGRVNEAKLAANEALKLNPDNDKAKNLLERLTK